MRCDSEIEMTLCFYLFVNIWYDEI